MSTKKLQHKTKVIGYGLAIVLHILLLLVLLFSIHRKPKEVIIPVAITMFEPGEATGEMVEAAQEQEESAPEPEPEPAPEPEVKPEPVPEPPPVPEVKSVVEPPMPEKKPELPKEVKKPEPPKPEVKPEPKKTKKQEMAERVKAAQKNTKKNTKTPTPAKKVSSSSLYNPSSGQAALKGPTNTSGISTDKASADQMYFSIVDTKIKTIWNAVAPKELNQVPSPVQISFKVNPLGKVTNIAITKRSNNPAMNNAAEELIRQLKSTGFVSFSASGIKNLGASSFPVDNYILEYQNR